MEYISREYLLTEYDRQHQGPPGGARKIIAEAPAADVRENKRGKWEIVMDGNAVKHQCDQCKKMYPNAYGYNFCPNCNADMR